MTAVRKPKPNQGIIEPVMSAMIDYNSYHFQPAIMKTEWNSGGTGRYLFVFTNQ